jgi:transposase-like protein/transposase InsO family protein
MGGSSRPRNIHLESGGGVRTLRMQYSSGLKARMIQRMSGRDSLSANKLSEEVGISQNTLSRWMREAPEEKKVKRNGHLAERSSMRPEDVPPAEKLRLVMEASTLSENELGEFLRRNGLHEAQLEEWRKKVEEDAVGALGKPKKGRHRKSPDAKKVQLLQREFLRKHRALAEVTALLALKKKLEALLGDEDESTTPRRRSFWSWTNALFSGGAPKAGATTAAKARRPSRGTNSPLQERKQVLNAVNSPEFRDLPPKQIVPRLASRGKYVASEPTIYRILRQDDHFKHREKSRPPTTRNKPEEVVATGPNESWSWDITYLKSPERGMFYCLYLAVDVWSRKTVAWEVHDAESSGECLDAVCGGVPSRGDRSWEAQRPHGQRQPDERCDTPGDPPAPRGDDIVQSSSREQRQPVLRVTLPNHEVPSGVSLGRLPVDRTGEGLGNGVCSLV